MTEKYVASGIFEGKAWTLHYDDESASYRTVSFPADPQFHAAGDRVSYYMDPDLTGTIAAEVRQITTLEAVYAVYWDTRRAYYEDWLVHVQHVEASWPLLHAKLRMTENPLATKLGGFLHPLPRVYIDHDYIRRARSGSTGLRLVRCRSHGRISLGRSIP